ncbi:hypothetical protein M5D96_003336 [Drosophila gunungcola]|uniref:Uncharacterized protein n=1 Tax=Drosophila gunungcola TaxID=103775 RepID=A0A9Q0BS06_9MUSC|nr:hypothetical protein M5D96_003336 [Drosophila gunungcola]
MQQQKRLTMITGRNSRSPVRFNAPKGVKRRRSTNRNPHRPLTTHSFLNLTTKTIFLSEVEM